MAEPLAPGATLGLLGGGQLGRMLALAAADLGLRVHVLAPEADAPAFEVAGRHTCAAYDDAAALAAFAEAVDVITFEFENVPAATAEALAARRPVRPSPHALAVAQNRIREKTFIAGLGLATAAFAPVRAAGDLAAALARAGAPAVLKTATSGYDGKGQARVATLAEAGTAFARFGGVPCILEAFVPFDREISVVAARGQDGTIAAYDPVENVHQDHILARTTAPARIAPAQAAAARAMAEQVLAALDYVGVLGLELFAFDDGRLFVNEIAPRVHNSGHWTMDACATSQFTQHVRAVCLWPLGDPARHADAVMHNLLGAGVAAWRDWSARPHAHLHLYGKREARPGRKMGHVTEVFPLGSAAQRG